MQLKGTRVEEKKPETIWTSCWHCADSDGSSVEENSSLGNMTAHAPAGLCALYRKCSLAKFSDSASAWHIISTRQALTHFFPSKFQSYLVLREESQFYTCHTCQLFTPDLSSSHFQHLHTLSVRSGSTNRVGTVIGLNISHTINTFSRI